MDGLISGLRIVIKQPGVSAKKEDLVDCTDLVAELGNQINAEALCLDHDNVR
jgi:hypothetical protein